jgi:hypothetical protein
MGVRMVGSPSEAEAQDIPLSAVKRMAKLKIHPRLPTRFINPPARHEWKIVARAESIPEDLNLAPDIHKASFVTACEPVVSSFSGGGQRSCDVST